MDYPAHERMEPTVRGTIDDLHFDEHESLDPVRPEVADVINARTAREQYRQVAEAFQRHVRDLDRLVPPERRTSYHHRARELALRTAEIYEDAAEVAYE